MFAWRDDKMLRESGCTRRKGKPFYCSQSRVNDSTDDREHKRISTEDVNDNEESIGMKSH